MSSVRWDGTIYFKEQSDASQGKPPTILISTNKLKPGVLAYGLSPPNWNLCLIRFFSSHHDNGISEIFSSPVSNHYSMKTVFPTLFFPSCLLCAGGAFRPLQLPYPDSGLPAPLQAARASPNPSPDATVQTRCWYFTGSPSDTQGFKLSQKGQPGCLVL